MPKNVFGFVILYNRSGLNLKKKKGGSTLVDRLLLKYEILCELSCFSLRDYGENENCETRISYLSDIVRLQD